MIGEGKKNNWRIFYPVLLGIYAVLELVDGNLGDMLFSAGIRSILVTIFFSIAVYLVFGWFIKDGHKAALLCAWFMIFFFAYGHIYFSLGAIKIFGVMVVRHRFLFPLWLLIFGLGAWWIYKQSWELKSISRILNITCLVLLAIPIWKITIFEWHRYQAISIPVNDQLTALIQDSQPVPMDQYPDVYYIILDGYPRQDALLQYHHFDNGDFIAKLKDIGFYVPACSQSNYAMTGVSLASSLNMSYLEGINDYEDYIEISHMISHNTVQQFLENLGYKTISTESGYWFTEIRGDDTFFIQERTTKNTFLDGSGLSEFEVLFVRTTALGILEGTRAAWVESIFQNPNREVYERILFQFDQLARSPDLPGPKFVFMHIGAPHFYPLLFAADGTFKVSTAMDPALGDEIQYLNGRILDSIQAIITRSKNPPVIILQSDHGLDWEVRGENFTAILFPGHGDSVLYPTLSPVNIFRLVFNTYFGQRYPLLPDISYQLTYGKDYSFTRVTYPCNP